MPRWISRMLLLAGVYNLAWGLWAIALPLAIFEWAGMELPRYPNLWQCIGMIVGVYGLGYLIAATDPARHWPIVLVGLLGKVFGPIGFVWVAVQGELPWVWGLTILTNDLIWWFPFAAALYYAFRVNSNTSLDGNPLPLETAMRTIVSQRGASLLEISSRMPTLVVFLRHAGCTFCREALSDLSAVRDELKRQGVDLAIVHMSSPMDATMMLRRYDLEGMHHFSDPHCVLYRAFDLRRGNLRELLSPSIWWRGFVAAIVHKHGLGRLAGDGFRMPGTFLLRDGKILAALTAKTAADRPDYLALAGQAFQDSSQPIKVAASTSSTPRATNV